MVSSYLECATVNHSKDRQSTILFILILTCTLLGSTVDIYIKSHCLIDLQGHMRKQEKMYEILKSQDYVVKQLYYLLFELTRNLTISRRYVMYKYI